MFFESEMFFLPFLTSEYCKHQFSVTDVNQTENIKPLHLYLSKNALCDTTKKNCMVWTLQKPPTQMNVKRNALYGRFFLFLLLRGNPPTTYDVIRSERTHLHRKITFSKLYVQLYTSQIFMYIYC